MDEIQEEELVSCRIDPLSANMRFYVGIVPNRPLHLMKERYYKVLTLQFEDNGHVRITACQDAPNRQEQHLIYNELVSRGYIEASYRHKHKEVIYDLTKPFHASITLRHTSPATSELQE